MTRNLIINDQKHTYHFYIVCSSRFRYLFQVTTLELRPYLWAVYYQHREHANDDASVLIY